MKKVLAYVVRVYPALMAVLRKYPAAAAALLNIAVAVVAFFGFSVTGEQLLYVFGIVTALFGALVHLNVTPVSKDKL